MTMLHSPSTLKPYRKFFLRAERPSFLLRKQVRLSSAVHVRSLPGSDIWYTFLADRPVELSYHPWDYASEVLRKLILVSSAYVGSSHTHCQVGLWLAIHTAIRLSQMPHSARPRGPAVRRWAISVSFAITKEITVFSFPPHIIFCAAERTSSAEELRYHKATRLATSYICCRNLKREKCKCLGK